MVTAEEFAAESAGLAEESAGNAHKAMLARLDHELQARKRLQKEFKELKARKQAIKQNNDSKREKLRKLPGHLNSILTAAQPLEKYIGADQGLPAMTKTSPEAYLPPAMYILFVYLNEFRKVNGETRLPPQLVRLMARRPTASNVLPAISSAWGGSLVARK